MTGRSQRAHRRPAVAFLLTIALPFYAAAQSRTARFELPQLEVEGAGGAVVLGRVVASAECHRDGEAAVCTSTATYDLTNEGDGPEALRVGATERASVSCMRASGEPVDCAAVTVGSRGSLRVHIRAEQSVPVEFERTWIHDESLGMGSPHGGAFAAGARHPLTGADWGRASRAPLRLSWRSPRGVEATERSFAVLQLEGDLELVDGGAHRIEAYGAYRAQVVDGRVHGGFLGGVTGALGYERRAGFAGRIGYEATFGPAPVALEVSFESARSLGPGMAGIVWLYTPTIVLMGAGVGVGPAVWFEDGAHVGTRLAFDVTFVVSVRVMLTFERDLPRQTGFYLGLTL